MRYLTLPAAALLLLGTALPALAGAGMPEIARLRVGEHTAVIRNDSFSARTGANLFTVEIAGLSPGQSVHFRLIGPRDQVVEVPLHELVVLSGPAEDHGAMDMSGPGAMDMSSHSAMDMSGQSAMDMSGHGAMDMSSQSAMDMSGHSAMHMGGHGAMDMSGHGAASPGGSDTWSGRGKAALDSTGPWKGIVEIADGGSGISVGRTLIEVRSGGPARSYLWVTGLLIFGFLLYGGIQRARLRDIRR